MNETFSLVFSKFKYELIYLYEWIKNLYKLFILKNRPKSAETEQNDKKRNTQK